jgi:hypothetical protein
MTMILIMIGLVILIGIGIKLGTTYDYEGFGVGIAVLSGVVLFVALLFLPANYFREVSNINDYYAVKSTIEESRKNDISEIERAALTTKIIETNEWLANVQYWNKTIFDIYVPNEVMNLKPLK